MNKLAVMLNLRVGILGNYPTEDHSVFQHGNYVFLIFQTILRHFSSLVFLSQISHL